MEVTKYQRVIRSCVKCILQHGFHVVTKGRLSLLDNTRFLVDPFLPLWGHVGNSILFYSFNIHTLVTRN